MGLCVLEEPVVRTVVVLGVKAATLAKGGFSVGDAEDVEA